MDKELIDKIAREYKRHRDFTERLLAPRRATKKLEEKRDAYYEKKKWWDA